MTLGCRSQGLYWAILHYVLDLAASAWTLAPHLVCSSIGIGPSFNRFYYLFGFLMLVLVILVVTCAEISITLAYFQLTNEAGPLSQQKTCSTYCLLYMSMWSFGCTGLQLVVEIVLHKCILCALCLWIFLPGPLVAKTGIRTIGNWCFWGLYYFTRMQWEAKSIYFDPLRFAQLCKIVCNSLTLSYILCNFFHWLWVSFTLQTCPLWNCLCKVVAESSWLIISD